MTKLAHYARKRFLKLFEIGLRQIRFNVEDQVETVRVGGKKFILPHDLPEPSLAAIANHGAAYFPRDGDSISLLAYVVSQKESRKEGSMNPVALLINPAKLQAIAQRLHQ
ncbi:MAG TPA: hypothetical protein VG324_00450 [Blastocatellia bacterium]|nr:hypothetical protein [Blastocatellia bacterium]